MAQNITSQLQLHYTKEVRTIATCCYIMRQNGTKYYFTSHNTDLMFDGQLYIASVGQSPTAVTSSSSLDVDNVDVQLAINSDLITEQDIFAGLWSNADFELFEINYNDTSMGRRVLRTGNLGEFVVAQTSVNTELRGLMQSYQQSIGRVIGPNCDAVLGDTRCKRSLVDLTFTGSVTNVSNNRTFTCDLVNLNTYFDFGLITWTSGLNINLRMEIKTYTVGSLLLQLNMPFAILAGDTFSVVAGCNLSKTHCKDKFNNFINFRGFPDVPSTDKVLSSPGATV